MTTSWQTLKQRATTASRRHSALLMLFGAGILSALLYATAPVPAPEQLEEKAWPVSVVVATPTQLQPTFRAYGRVESRNSANLSADLFAVIKEVRVKEGDRVDAGTVLVSLDDGELALDVAARKADLSESGANVRSIESELAHVRSIDAEHRSVLHVAQAKLARHQQLLEDRLISQSLFDEVLRQTNAVEIDYQGHSQRFANLPNRLQAAEALRDRARAALGRAKLIANKTQIIAPFDGIVLAVPAAIGARAQPGTPLLRIADSKAFEVRVPVPPGHSAEFLQVGNPSSKTRPSISARLGNGTLLPFSRLAGAVMPGQTSADALFTWSDTQGPAAPVGTTVELLVTLPAADQLVALPAQSLYENERVYIVEQQRLRPVAVARVGEHRSIEGEYQVLVRSAELQAGMRIITTQLPKAMAGLKVATIDDSPTDTSDALARQAEPQPQPEPPPTHNASTKRRTPANISLPSKTEKSDAATTPRSPSRRYRMS
ncbi:MAG: efflux RND transporter periplasmic adaptor subunit [Pseudomonadales bacterium]